MPQRAGVEGGGVDVAWRVSDGRHCQSSHRQGRWCLTLLCLQTQTFTFQIPPASCRAVLVIGPTPLSQVNSSARGGLRFIGSVLQQASGSTNGRLSSPKRGCRSPSGSPPGVPAKDRELEESSYSPGEQPAAAHSSFSPSILFGCHVDSLPPDLKLLVFFHSWPPGCAPLDSLACHYHQGALSMRVSRKGHVVSALEADWLELTAAYYGKGWSLVDSFVYWDTPKGLCDVGLNLVTSMSMSV